MHIEDSGVYKIAKNGFGMSFRSCRAGWHSGNLSDSHSTRTSRL